MKTKLKPCPFCGGEAELIPILMDYDTAESFVRCRNCFAKGKTYKTAVRGEDKLREKQAIAAWNRRVSG